jgi:hypothetical protein
MTMMMMMIAVTMTHDPNIDTIVLAAAGLLDLAPDRDSEMLAALVDDDPAADVVLSEAAEEAYQRYASRANRMWSLGDPLARYLY